MSFTNADFLTVVVDAHIVVAAMKLLGLKCPTDAPKKEYLGDLNEANDEQKKSYLNHCVTTMVSQFALHHAHPTFSNRIYGHRCYFRLWMFSNWLRPDGKKFQ